jgi:hypothetical protein
MSVGSSVEPPASRLKADAEDQTPRLLARQTGDLKSAVHRDLINKVDLEKVMLIQDGRGKQQLLAIIHQLVGQQGVPLSASERDRL